MDEVVVEGGVLGCEFGCFTAQSFPQVLHDAGSYRALGFISTSSQDVLTAILRDGAQRLLVDAVEAEVREWIARH